MIPILPANAVKRVRPFFVSRLLKLRENAVNTDIDVFLGAYASSDSFASSSSENGAESSMILPSNSFTILVEYLSASSGLCVTMMTSFSSAISFNSSIIWTLVSESRAPVGSSASRISGSLINALAIATRCICPPDI